MALIIAARFETFDTAQNAVVQLMTIGIPSDHIHTFYVNPGGRHDRYPLGGDEAIDPNAGGASLGAVGGAALIGLIGGGVGAAVGYAFGASLTGALIGMGVGAYVGSLAGAMKTIGSRRRRRTNRSGADEPNRESGVLLAVNTPPDATQRIGRILRDAGGLEVERARGRWEDGAWRDFDPLEAPNLEKNL